MSTSHSSKRSKFTSQHIARLSHLIADLAQSNREDGNWIGSLDQILEKMQSFAETGDQFGREFLDWSMAWSWPRPWNSSVLSPPAAGLVFVKESSWRHQKLHAVVSSKTGRHNDASFAWNRRLEMALSQCFRDRASVLLSYQLPFGQHIEHVALRFGLPIVRVRLFTGVGGFEKGIGQLLQAILDLGGSTSDSKEFDLAILMTDEGPRLAPSNQVTSSTSLDLDSLMVKLPDVVHAIEIREGGRIDRLISERLADPSFPAGSVRISIDYPTDNLGQASTSLERWLERGAVGELVRVDDKQSFGKSSCRSTSGDLQKSLQPIIHQAVWMRSQVDLQSDWLTHCTRGRSGPWPDESLQEYYDQLLLGERTRGFHARESLLRILKMQRILATDYLKRGGQKSVSFSAVPILDLLERRTFQAHLGRWDWEPYGICIRKSVAECQGAREVVYVDKAVDDSSAKLAGSSLGTPSLPPAESMELEYVSNIWKEEREWRHPGDLRLCQLQWEDALVFVPSVCDAEYLAPWSRFPILVLDELENRENRRN